MNFIASLIGLLCLAVQHGSFAAQHKNGIQMLCEGREAVLHFGFPGRLDINVALQIGNRPPFYNNGGLLASGLSKDQLKRFQVKPHINHTHYELILTISNVSQEDGGTYIGLAYIRGEVETSLTKKIALVIEYPPRNLRCKYISSSNIDAISSAWGIIECAADIGTMRGYIVCFQEGEVMPLNGRLSKNTTTLLQQIWVKRYKPISCCSPYFEDVVISDNCSAVNIGKAENIPTTIAKYGTHDPSLYFTDEISVPFGENISTTIHTFDSDCDIPSHIFPVSDIMVLCGIILVLIIMVMMVFLIIKLMKIERVVRESKSAVQQLESQGKKIEENIEHVQENKDGDKIKDHLTRGHRELIAEIKKLFRRSLLAKMSSTQEITHERPVSQNELYSTL